MVTWRTTLQSLLQDTFFIPMAFIYYKTFTAWSGSHIASYSVLVWSRVYWSGHCTLEWSLYAGVVTVHWSDHCTLEWSLYVGVVTVRWRLLLLCSAVLEFCDVLDKEYSDWPESSMNLLKVQIAYQDLVQWRWRDHVLNQAACDLSRSTFQSCKPLFVNI